MCQQAPERKRKMGDRNPPEATQSVLSINSSVQFSLTQGHRQDSQASACTRTIGQCGVHTLPVWWMSMWAFLPMARRWWLNWRVLPTRVVWSRDPLMMSSSLESRQLTSWLWPESSTLPPAALLCTRILPSLFNNRKVESLPFPRVSYSA